MGLAQALGPVDPSRAPRRRVIGGAQPSPIEAKPCKGLSSGYIFHMGEHSLAEAKNELSDLIDRALRGEEVVITRDGRPVVALRPVNAAPRPLSDADLDWLASHRVGRRLSPEDAGSLLERMRDEWER